MLETRGDAERLATRWGIDADDIMLIALNACGLDADIGVSRLRFRLRLNSRPDDQLYMILSLGRRRSPFKLVDTKVLLGGSRSRSSMSPRPTMQCSGIGATRAGS